MISFNSGKAVGVVDGGEYNKQKIYVKEEDQRDERDNRDLNEDDIFELLDDDDFNMNKYKRFPVRDRQKLVKALKQKMEPLDDYLVDKYHNISTKLNDRVNKEFELSTGEFVPIPDKETERVFIAGKTGSGKSKLTKKYAENYAKMFPNRKTYIFTKHEDEKAYQELTYTEIHQKDEVMNNPIDITILKDSLVIFDDCDKIQDKKLLKAFEALISDIIANGRKYNIHIVILGHQLMDYKHTRDILNELNRIIFFNNTSKHHINRYLKIYAGLSPETIKRISGLKSRWSLLSVEHPQYLMHEHGIFMI